MARRREALPVSSGAAPLGRTVEMLVLRWEGADTRAPAPRLRRRLAALSPAGIDLVLLTDLPSDRVGTALGPPRGPGRRWIWPTCGGAPVICTLDGPVRLRCAGDDTSRADPVAAAASAVLDAAAARGVGAGLVLIVLATPADHRLLGPGTERCPLATVRSGAGGAPAHAVCADTVEDLVVEQLARRGDRRVPTVDEDPAWIIVEDDTGPRRHRVAETLLTLAAGGIATRGAVEEDGPSSVPLVLAAGVHRGAGAEQELRPLPRWTGLEPEPPPHDHRRILDLRTGVLLREERGVPVPLRTMRLASAARPGVVALRAEAATGRLRPGPALIAPAGEVVERGGVGALRWMRSPADGDGTAGVVVAAAQRTGRSASVRTVDRVARYVTGPGRPRVADAVEGLTAADGDGFDRLLAEQRATWADRWDAVDVRIPADPDAERALRFALFGLWGLVRADDRADGLAVGARGLSGPGYRGHVFWDADVFVLPALASIHPPTARAMVRYRIARLPAAREHARRQGHAGARFPWESAAGGEDVTPTAGLLGGRRVTIRTGEREEHITADVAWAAVHHARWTAEPQFLMGPARSLLLETARYWASRIRVDTAGRGHIDGVIGPDEYHEDVDDDAYTNVMARWNLRAAADLADRIGASGGEARHWRELADALVDGLDPETGRHEQFAGYHGLEPLRVDQVAQPPVAADILLGRERVASSQLIKQPAVLMLHHLVPAEADPSSLGPDLDLYEPRTAHGSSLSPGITAAVLARSGRTEEALVMMRLALDLDLDDLTGATAAGLHVATLGGAWQALLHGFAGVRVERGMLCVDPHLPAAWPSLEVRFRCLGRRIRLSVDQQGTTVWTEFPLRVRLHGGAPVRVHDRMRAPRPDATRRTP